MKKLLILFMTVMALTVNAKTTQHIQFMGVPLNGTVKSFVTKMQNKGFTIDTKFDDGNIMMRGTFTNRDIELFIFGTPESKQVYKVVIYYPKKETWKALKNDYFNVKALFDRKYELDSDYAFFMDPYDEGDGDEIEAVENDKCRFVSFYNATGGMIGVQISTYRQIKVTYEDEINIERARQEQ